MSTSIQIADLSDAELDSIIMNVVHDFYPVRVGFVASLFAPLYQDEHGRMMNHLYNYIRSRITKLIEDGSIQQIDSCYFPREWHRVIPEEFIYNGGEEGTSLDALNRDDIESIIANFVHDYTAVPVQFFFWLFGGYLSSKYRRDYGRYEIKACIKSLEKAKVISSRGWYYIPFERSSVDTLKNNWVTKR